VDASAGTLMKSFEGIAPDPDRLTFSRLEPACRGRKRPCDSSLGAAVRREQLAFDAHLGPVTSVAFFPDGKRIASSSDDGTLRVWERGTASVAEDTDGWSANRPARALVDGSTIAAASDKSVHVWDVATGELRRTLAATPLVRGLAFTPDARVVSGGEDGDVILWEIATGQRACVASKATPKGPTASPCRQTASWSPPTTAGAPVSRDGTVRVWDIATGELRATFRDHTNWSTAVLFAPDGKTLASVDWNGRSSRDLRPATRLVSYVSELFADRAPLRVRSAASCSRLATAGRVSASSTSRSRRVPRWGRTDTRRRASPLT
jgi:WD40 repeat protein